MRRIRLPRARARALVRWARQQRDPALLTRALIVCGVAAGRSAAEVAGWLHVARSHVYRVVARFSESRREGLLDGRASNGPRLVDDAFRNGVRELLDGTPRAHGFIRSTWTRELLVIVMTRQDHPPVSVCTMGRVLRCLQARRGRPKPIVKCPLSARQKRRRIKQIRDLVTDCPSNEVVVYEDEIDIHLNPKLGLDWMNRGHQKLVMTPGKNEKAYVAGTLDARTREVLWVGGPKKSSGLFIQMLHSLVAHYSDAACIHVVLDNYGVHKSKATKAALRTMPRIRLHFLPPYSPDDNLIERLWLDLHANVTRNHSHAEMIPLCRDVGHFLDHVSPWTPRQRPLILQAA
jgi:transposase